MSRARASRRTSFDGSARNLCLSSTRNSVLRSVVCRPPRRGIPEVSFVTWLRQIQCEAFQIAERAIGQGTIVGSTQDYPGRLVCIESFLPARRT